MWVLKGTVSTQIAAEFWANALESFCIVVSFYEHTENEWHIEGISENEPDLVHIENTLNTLSSDDLNPPKLHSEPLPERNWLEENKRAFPPLTIGDFYLYGSHHTDPLPLGKHSLLIEAATAFGSGHHETTSGCLSLLQEQAQHSPWASACDLGCGSGVLALAMSCLLPDAPVLALDNDPEAVAVATHNVILNKKEHHVIVGQSEGLDSLSRTKTFDMIVANILAQPLIDLASSIHACLEPQGRVILSGFLDTQWPEVQQAYINLGFRPEDRFIHNHWVSLCLRKESI